MQFVVRYLITVGTMFEWLDFVIFAFLMPTLAGQFFPLQPTASYLLTLAIFALGFLSRPIGGVLLGRLGDSKGCQSAFSYSLLLMGLPSILLGVMPTFSQVGWWAPAGLLLLRLIQGISCGGEFTHSFIYLHSMQPTNKMKHTNYAWLGALTGTFLGSVALYLITHFTSAAALSIYLWRWVFLCGGFLAMGMGLLRFLFLPARKMVQAKPKWTKITSPSCLRVFLVTSPMATAIYTALIFLPGYFHIQGVMSTAQSSIYASISTLALMVMIILVPLLFRNMTSRSLFILGNRMLLICALPICWLMSVHDFYVAGIVLIIPVAIILSAGLTLICELCPKGGAQCLIISFAYNIAMSLCGGFTPLLATALSFHVSVFWGPMIIPTVASIIFLLLRRATLLFWQ